VRNALEKISKLFSASYGKNGCVIGEKFTDEWQMFDFHLPGKPCGQAILVECGMRDFAVALEAFHDDVLVYLNKIKIVHATAGSWGGPRPPWRPSFATIPAGPSPRSGAGAGLRPRP
jgi:hypothetical protein